MEAEYDTRNVGLFPQIFKHEFGTNGEWPCATLASPWPEVRNNPPHPRRVDLFLPPRLPRSRGSSYGGHRAALAVRSWRATRRSRQRNNARLEGGGSCWSLSSLLDTRTRLRESCRTVLVPPENSERSQRVPPAGLSDLLQFEECSAGVPVLEHPESLPGALLQNHTDRVLEPLIVGGMACLEVVQRSQHVMVPARREREPRERRIDSPECAVRTVQIGRASCRERV